MTRPTSCALGAFAVALGLTACVSVPTGPSVMVLPGRATSFEQFAADDAVCRSWAAQGTGTTANQAATQSAITSSVVGAGVGAALGAGIGAAAGNPGVGAAVGAASGLLVGSASGAVRGDWAAGSVQGRYDSAYMQCMYAKGNQIPVPGASAVSLASRTPPSPPPGRSRSAVPPPPPGPPPPPPPY
jgi:Glycine-zipper domain